MFWTSTFCLSFVTICSTVSGALVCHVDGEVQQARSRDYSAQHYTGVKKELISGFIRPGEISVHKMLHGDTQPTVFGIPTETAGKTTLQWSLCFLMLVLHHCTSKDIGTGCKDPPLIAAPEEPW